MTVHAVDTGGASDNQTYTLDVADTNTHRRPEIHDRAGAHADAHAAGRPVGRQTTRRRSASCRSPGAINRPSAVVYDPATNSLVVSLNCPSGYPHLVRASAE